MTRRELDYLSPEFAEVMRQYEPGTDITALEVFMLGQAFLGWLATTQMLGHDSPGNSLEYVHLDAESGSCPKIMRDFVAWTSGRKRFAPGCDERLAAFILDTKWAAAKMGAFVASAESA